MLAARSDIFKRFLRGVLRRVRVDWVVRNEFMFYVPEVEQALKKLKILPRHIFW